MQNRNYQSVLRGCLIYVVQTSEVLFSLLLYMLVQSDMLSVSGGLPATVALRRGLTELHDACQHVLNTFEVKP